MKSAPSLLIVAGEPSGDAHAARVLRALRRHLPDLTAWGFGGEALAAEGTELLAHVRDLSVMGFWEVLKRYGFFRRCFHNLLAEIDRRPPDAVLLVDYPGFNLRLAAALRGRGIPVIQYICPQVWAWKKSRIPRMVESLDALVCIFPFEPAVFAGTKLKVVDGGHPMVEETASVLPDLDWGGSHKLALVPGSRLQEIDRIYPAMQEAAARLLAEFPGLRLRVPAANPECLARLRSLTAARPDLPAPELISGRMRELVRGADAALVTSGTATLETALLGTPMVVVYKTSAFTYALGRLLVKVPFIGMVNLVAEREVCPEFIQGAATPAALAEAAAPLLRDTPARRRMLEGLTEVRGRLRSDAGGERVAEVVLPLLRRRRELDLAASAG